MRMKFNFGHYNLRGYLQLGLCIALENYIHSNLSAYAVLTVFMQASQFTHFATHKRRITVTTIMKGLINKVLIQ